MITVLMPVYNAGEYLSRAIESVRAQTVKDWMMVVIDDGSTDPLVSEVLDHVDDLRILVWRLDTLLAEREASCRYATLINEGAAATDSDYLTYLCGDDEYLPDRFERMLARLAEGHDVVYGPQVLQRDGVQFGLRSTYGVLSSAYEAVDLNSVMQTRESFECVGGFPTARSLWRNADAHMWNRLTDAGYRFVPVDGDEPTDIKNFRREGVDDRVIAGLTPWH